MISKKIHRAGENINWALGEFNNMKTLIRLSKKAKLIRKSNNKDSIKPKIRLLIPESHLKLLFSQKGFYYFAIFFSILPYYST